MEKQIKEDVLIACPNCDDGIVVAPKIVEGEILRGANGKVLQVPQECLRCKGTGKISEYQELIRPRIILASTGKPTIYESASQVAERVRKIQEGLR